jgi:hypothetical protein
MEGNMALIAVENYPRTEEFLAAVAFQFEKGAKLVDVTMDQRIIQTIFPPRASQELLALRVAKAWVEDPSVFKELSERLDEVPVAWD